MSRNPKNLLEGDYMALRYCDLCLGVDDHPRHVRALSADEPDFTLPSETLDRLNSAPISALAQLINPRVRIAHMDCCATAGCEVCAFTEAENQGRRGQELIDHLAALRAETVA